MHFTEFRVPNCAVPYRRVCCDTAQVLLEWQETSVQQRCDGFCEIEALPVKNENRKETLQKQGSKGKEEFRRKEGKGGKKGVSRRTNKPKKE